MYELIYDYHGDDGDVCRGITETYKTWLEAQEAMESLKKSGNYCYFDIVCVGE